MRRLLPVFAIALLLAGCYDSHFGEPGNGGGETLPTVTLTKLRSLYTGTPFTIETDAIVTGVVTTSDRDENFYRTFCIEEDGTGIEIMAGLSHLHNDYPVGSRVTIRLKGLSVGESYGTLQIGRRPAPGSGFATDYIGSTKAAVDVFVTRGADAPQPPEPVLRNLGELTPPMCGSLICVEALRYTPEELAEATWAGYKRFTDGQGREIFTYVRTYAAFAGHDVPAGSVTLTGILQYDAKGDGRYLLKLRDEEGCTY